jgi:hypothetical protein
MGLPVCVGWQREFFKVGLGGIELGVTAVCEKKERLRTLALERRKVNHLSRSLRLEGF